MSKVLHRTVSLDGTRADEENRTIEVAFSSEEPVQRHFGREILDHAPSSVRLGRLNSGAAVLVDHDSTNHVGVVEEARIDDDRRGRAILRFGRGTLAQEVFNDIQDGIRKNVSVGYVVHDEKRSADENNEVRFRDWEPFEISIVAVPADASVGVGRSQNSKEESMSEKKEEVAVEEPRKEERKAAPSIDVKAEREASAREERERISSIHRIADEHGMAELGRRYADEGKSVAAFQRAVLDEIGKQNNETRVQRAKEGKDDDLSLDERDIKDYSLIRAMNCAAAITRGDATARKVMKDSGLELEVSDAAANKWGVKQRGMLIPPEVLNYMAARSLKTRDLSIANDSALVGTDHLAASYIEVLRNSTSVMQAGARVLDGLVGDVDIPRQTAAASATWVSAEDGQATESEATFNQLTLSPKDLALFTEVTRRLLQQATPSVEGIVRNDLFQAIALGIDSAAHYGSGVAGQPTGIASTSGINTVTFAASQPTYAELVQMVTETKIDNADMGSTAFVTDANGWDAAMTTEKASNTAQFVWNEANNTVVGRRTFVSNQITNGDWFFGNYADLLIGFWSGLDLTVDPYTNSLRGRVRYILFQTLDMGIRHAVSFVRGNSGSVA